MTKNRYQEVFNKAVELAKNVPTKHIATKLFNRNNNAGVEIVVNARGEVFHIGFGRDWTGQGWIEGEGAEELKLAVRSIKKDIRALEKAIWEPTYNISNF